jgi:AcrR family transcriptional regulator
MASKTSSRRPSLSHERIVAAATVLIDREGAEALSARKLAAELGCEAMSLYHHMANMRQLLDEVVDQALGMVELPPADAVDPRKALGAMTHRYLHLAGERPQLFRVVSSRRWRTPGELAYQSRMIELLIVAGLSPRAALRAARMLVVYLNGAGLAIAGWKLDTDQPPMDVASPQVQKLMRLSTAASVSRDVLQGLDLMLAAVLAEVR